MSRIWKRLDRARVVDLIEKWRGLLLLHGHHVNVTFSETPDYDDKPGARCSASCKANTPYMSGHRVTIYPHFLDDDADEQERKIIHELAHIITEPSRQVARELAREQIVTWREIRDTNETLTDWIASIAMALQQGPPPTGGKGE